MGESEEIHMDKMALFSSLRVGHLQVIRDFSGVGSGAFTLCSPAKFCFYRVMPKPSLSAIVNYCDRILRTKEVQDYEGAVNGLQVENRGDVRRIAATVDASLATAKRAIAVGADLMIVHHGLFWSTRQPWTGKNHELLRLLLENNLAVYSSHLPLDAHPKLGNNAQLCAALGLKKLKPFFFSHGQTIGFKSQAGISRAELARRLTRATGAKPRILPGGQNVCEKIGVVTGGAGGDLKQAVEEGVDTFVTGEGPHWTYAAAEELGLNVLYGGHYATETFGVRALAAHLSQKFNVPWKFLDYPTGL
ncbi:MAG: Nif3-like dinuclear metal center hexameric protein [Verrucomicrobiia bacterium]